jgi:phosphatidylserine/phosphatidylglycerophosphate/cardiolipin synthase-like enzyme
MRRRRLPILMLALTLALLATVSALADPPDPAVYLTANLTAVATSPAVTAMEQALLDRIAGAVTSIDAAIYDFERVSVRDALIAAHARGVAVRIVADDVARASPSYAPALCRYWKPPASPSPTTRTTARILHDKYLIFDRRQVWTGSTNLSDNDFTLNHNHSLVLDRRRAGGPATKHDFDQMVAGPFGAQKTASLTTTVTYHGFPVEVYFSPQDGAMAQVIAEVEAAQTSIDFAIFFFTEDALADALIAAHQRGVVIRGLWDALGAGNASSDDEALCAAGIPVKIENTAGKMHHKLMVIDAHGSDPTVITGSLNWTAAADARNSENTVIVHDGATAQTLAAGFEEMWAGMAVAPCVPETGLAERLFLPVVVRAGEAAPDVRLVRIVYNSEGDDVAGERVEMRNFGGAAVALSGWTLEDAGSYRYTFPAFSLAAGGTVTVWVKGGVDTGTELFSGRGSAVWNNEGDVGTVRDGDGSVVDVCEYVGGGVEVGCE